MTPRMKKVITSISRCKQLVALMERYSRSNEVKIGLETLFLLTVGFIGLI
jgi:hypothetical protein